MLPQVKTILFATDLEDKTQETMALAASMAVHHQAKLVVMHAMEPISARMEGMVNSYLPAETIDTLRRDSLKAQTEALQNQVDVFFETYSGESGLTEKPESILIEGVPYDAIMDAAREHKADLIIMNSRTHSALGQMILGSTANKVIHHSDIPVMVVPIRH